MKISETVIRSVKLSLS